MDESIKCECGNRDFLYFGRFVRCQNCYNEYIIQFKGTFNNVEMVLNIRRFGVNGERQYGEWEEVPNVKLKL